MRTTLNEFGFAATARGHRPGLHHEGVVPGDLVPLGSTTDVTQMEMAGEKHVGAGGRELLHRHLGSTDQMFFVVAFGQLKGMVRHDDLHDMRRRGPQARGRPPDLSLIQGRRRRT